MSTGKKRKREEGNEETDGQVPDEFCCSITHQVMVDPVCTKDGHSYERKSITKWFSERQPPTSPKTGLVLTSTELIPNHNLRQAIQNWREAEQKRKEKVRAKMSPDELVEDILKMLPTDASDKWKKAIGDLVHNKVGGLNLNYNKISDEGAKALAEALKVNTALQKLELYSNIRISDAVEQQIKSDRLRCR